MRVTADVLFAVIPEWVLDAEISSNAVRLYGVLARYANDAGRSHPSRRRLADRMRVSTKTVDRAMNELEEIGAVTVHYRTTEDGDYTSNDYQLHLLPQRPGVATPVSLPRDIPVVSDTTVPTVATRMSTKP